VKETHFESVFALFVAGRVGPTGDARVDHLPHDGARSGSRVFLTSHHHPYRRGRRAAARRGGGG
jgi:hypothetical protein